MATDEDLPLKEYVGYVWIGDAPGIRLSVWARSGAEARAQVDAEYGAGHVASLWNEEDAQRPRHPADVSGAPSIDVRGNDDR